MRTILKPKCPFCSKDIQEISRTDWGDTYLIESKCGHTIVREKLVSEEVWPNSRDGRFPFQFQKDGVLFLERAECNGLLLDEQGLGKTVQECMLLNRNFEDLTPALIVVKSGLRAQWWAELFRWTGHIPETILKSTDKPQFDYADIFIVSIDTLRLLRPDINYPGDEEFERWKASGDKRAKKNYKPIWSDDLCARFKHICIDEAHLLKNDGSARTKALRKIVQAGEMAGQRPRIICMSGTAVEKHAGEFFVPLNLTRPEMFNNKTRFLMYHVAHHPISGKPMGLKDPDRWKELTGDFIIRRLRKDVLPDLPKIFRQFRLAELEGGDLEAYKRLVQKFMKDMDAGKIKTPTDVLGYLSHMRHVTGVGKTEACCDYIEEFLLESGESTYEAQIFNEKNELETKEITAGRKLVVFLHHHMAQNIIGQQIENLCKYGTRDPEEGAQVLNLYAPPLYLDASVPTMQRQKVVDEFKKPENRILIASTLVAAEGLNLQFVSDAVMMERQWNPSKEEQAEGRFPRPGSLASKINVVYLIAAGTIDDFLTTIVEQKRRNVANTLDGGEMDWNQDSLMMELAQVLASKGLAKWSF
jgi:SNF2 family DNA or RNA helicase